MIKRNKNSGTGEGSWMGRLRDLWRSLFVGASISQRGRQSDKTSPGAFDDFERVETPKAKDQTTPLVEVSLEVRWNTSAKVRWLENPKRNKFGLLVDPVMAKHEWDIHNSFVRDSLKYRNVRIGKRPNEVYFSEYFPEFQDLSREQLNWYLWWREAWRQGQKAPIDTSYLYLLIYELINFTWIPEKLDAYQLLKRMVEEYSSQAKWASLWAGDMAWELGFDDEAIRFYSRSKSFSRTHLTLAVKSMLGKADVREIEINEVIKANNSGTTHFATYEEELRKIFREVLLLAEEAVRRKNPQTCLFEELGSRKQKTRHSPYQSAIVGRIVHFRPIDVEFWAPYPNFYVLSRIFRRIENMHRQARGVKRFLKDGPLPEKWEDFFKENADSWLQLVYREVDKTIIAGPQSTRTTSSTVKVRSAPNAKTSLKPGSLASSIEEEKKQPRVRINLGMVQEIVQESADVQQLVEAWIGQDEVDNVSERAIRQESESHTPSFKNEPWVWDGSSASSGSSEDVKVALSELGEQELAFMREIVRREGRWDRSEAAGWAKARGVLITSLLDRINHRALELLDTALVIQSESEIMVDEDYYEEVCQVISSDA